MSDISAECYFAPSSAASIGYVHKQGTNIIGESLDRAALIWGLIRDGLRMYWLWHMQSSDSSVPFEWSYDDWIVR